MFKRCSKSCLLTAAGNSQRRACVRGRQQELAPPKNLEIPKHRDI